MSISINSAINAYNNAANITKNLGETSNQDKTANSDVFAGLVANPVENTIGSLRKAESSALGNVTKNADISDVVLAINNAETTLKTVIAVRDRLVNAFQELEKMPI